MTKTKELDEEALASVSAESTVVTEAAKPADEDKGVSKKKTSKLDKSRDFGTVYGSDDGSAFEQDGVLFDVLGLPIKKEK